LEEMMVATIDDDHLGVRAGELPRSVETAETATHDDYFRS
jgi:hypothetical protein